MGRAVMYAMPFALGIRRDSHQDTTHPIRTHLRRISTLHEFAGFPVINSNVVV